MEQHEIESLTDTELLNMIDQLTFLANAFNTGNLGKKVILNSLYGYITASYSTLANSNLGAAITSYGRYNIKRMSDHIVEHVGPDNAEITLQDTDSFHLSLSNVPKELKEPKERTKWIYDFTTENISPEITSYSKEISRTFNGRGMLKMDFEAIATSEIVVAKKRYACALWYDDRFLDKMKKKVVGLEIKRSSTPKDIKHAMDDVLDIIFTGDHFEALEYMKDFRKSFDKRKLVDIAINTSISDISKYYSIRGEDLIEKWIPKGATQTAKGVHLHNCLLENVEGFDIYDYINSGDKVKIVFLKRPIYPDALYKVFAFKDPSIIKTAGLNEMIDYDVLFDKGFKTPMLSIFEAIDWEFDAQKVKVKGIL